MDKNVITAATNVNSRDITFDIMKGIGIIAMIIGHCCIPHVLFKFIFMWHMPLFFIISGYFYKKKNNRDMFISLFTSLIIPYIFTSLIIVIVSTCISLFKGNFNSPFSLGMLFGSGSTNNPLLFGGHCFIGALWFLLALFWSKMIYNTISNRFTDSYHLGGGNNSIVNFCILYRSYSVHSDKCITRCCSTYFLLYRKHGKDK